MQKRSFSVCSKWWNFLKTSKIVRDFSHRCEKRKKKFKHRRSGLKHVKRRIFSSDINTSRTHGTTGVTYEWLRYPSLARKWLRISQLAVCITGQSSSSQ